MKARANLFKTNQKYLDAVGRCSYEEEKALDLDLIEHGQLEPVKVNRKMVPLDGHTRIQLLGDRGVEIEYEFRDFDTQEEEYYYVVMSNVMRRQLNDYQKVETMYRFFGGVRYKKETHEEFKRPYIDTLQVIKDGSVRSSEISKAIDKNDSNTRMILKKMTEQYYISRKINLLQAGGREFLYSLMPKGVQLLENKPMVRTIRDISKDIGVERNAVGKALHLIDKAPPDMKTMLINGTITIGQAYARFMGRDNYTWQKRWKETDRLVCPCCKESSMKKDFKKLESNTLFG